MRELHCSPYASHFDVTCTVDVIGRYYWRTGMQEEVASFIKGCMPCQHRGKPT